MLDFKTRHQQIIKHIQRCKRDLTVPRESEKLKKDLLALIVDLREDINQGFPTPERKSSEHAFSQPLDWSFHELFKNASDLLSYRECLGLAHLSEAQYADEYRIFLNNNKLLVKELEQKNPFVMHEHLIHLFNLLIDCQSMARGATAPKNQILANVELYQQMLVQLAAEIKSLDHDDLGGFKDYLDAFAQYALALSYGEPKFESIFHPELCVSIMKEAHIATRIAKEYERVSAGSSSDPSSSSSSSAPSSDPSSSGPSSRSDSVNGDETLTANTNSQHINFYTCGQGLFARTAVQSFAELEKHIASLGILQSKELTYNFDIARKRFAKEYDASHPSHSASNKEDANSSMRPPRQSSASTANPIGVEPLASASASASASNKPKAHKKRG